VPDIEFHCSTFRFSQDNAVSRLRMRRDDRSINARLKNGKTCSAHNCKRNHPVVAYAKQIWRKKVRWNLLAAAPRTFAFTFN